MLVFLSQFLLALAPDLWDGAADVRSGSSSFSLTTWETPSQTCEVVYALTDSKSSEDVMKIHNFLK